MERLHDAGYPSSRLTVNYRNHPQILELYNRITYKGCLVPNAQNAELERVGSAWDSFTQSRFWFRQAGVDGVRRLFINTTGSAKQVGNSRSWSNSTHVDVIKELLVELYRFKDGNGVRPEDVMIISPYKDQRRLIQKKLGEQGVGYRDNLTVDTALGQEAPVVIYSLTKPSQGSPLSTGFVADTGRMNVALSRGQKVVIIIGNLTVWNDSTIRQMQSHKRNKFLIELLRDVRSRRHTISWNGPETVTDQQAPGDGRRAHESRSAQSTAPQQLDESIHPLDNMTDIDENLPALDARGDRWRRTPPRPSVNRPRSRHHHSQSRSQYRSRYQSPRRSISRNRHRRSRSPRRDHRRRSPYRGRSRDRRDDYQDRRSAYSEVGIDREQDMERERLVLELERARQRLQERDAEIQNRERDLRRREEYNRSRSHREGRDSRGR
ncbi:hypothetical protein AWENTII_010313 [Aspergillus wentii]